MPPARLLLLCALLVAAGPALASTLYKYRNAYGIVSYSDRPIVPEAQPFIFRDTPIEPLEDQVHLEPTRTPTGLQFLVRNETFAPVEVELKLTNLRNAREGTSRIVRRVLPPRSTLPLTQLNARQPGDPITYKEKFRFALGDPAQRPQAYRYPLPWRGGPFRLTQGPNGRFSHFGPKGRYAMDIAMPEGTPIIAARAGIVLRTENRQVGRWPRPAGNFVRILHNDGTMSVYLHLKHGSVVVQEGQRVAQGALLAQSGNTGRSTAPHLHFVVQRNVGLAVESIPYRFTHSLERLPNFTAGNP